MGRILVVLYHMHNIRVRSLSSWGKRLGYIGGLWEGFWWSFITCTTLG